MNDKKGLSTIIVTLILILLSLVAVGVIWVVVSNILQSGAEQTSSGLGQLTLSLNLENVKVESNGDVSVAVKRNAGAGDLSGINFIVSDGENSQVVKKSESLGELATKTFTITSAELTDVAFVKEVSIAPISGTEGKEKIGSVVDTFEKNKIGLNDLKDYGIVSWWKLDGNAQDEIGNNDGTLQGGVTFTDGKFGKAGNFDGVNSYVKTNDIDFANEMSASLWVKFSDVNIQQVIIAQSALILPEAQLQMLGAGYGNKFRIRIDSDHTDASTKNCRTDSTTQTANDKWYYATFVTNGSQVSIYVNGDKESTNGIDSSCSGKINDNNENWGIGARNDGSFLSKGQIDEVMIFNKALSEKEVKAIYELDLG